MCCAPELDDGLWSNAPQLAGITHTAAVGWRGLTVEPTATARPARCTRHRSQTLSNATCKQRQLAEDSPYICFTTTKLDNDEVQVSRAAANCVGCLRPSPCACTVISIGRFSFENPGAAHIGAAINHTFQGQTLHSFCNFSRRRFRTKHVIQPQSFSQNYAWQGRKVRKLLSRRTKRARRKQPW